MPEPASTASVDCDAGRRLGCASFCCHLIVRLAPGEVDPGGVTRLGQSCVDKDLADGLCIYFERETKRCAVWNGRPRICREYDCNHDPLLQVVLRQGFRSLTELVTAALAPAQAQRLSIPMRDGDREPPDQPAVRSSNSS